MSRCWVAISGVVEHPTLWHSEVQRQRYQFDLGQVKLGSCGVCIILPFLLSHLLTDYILNINDYSQAQYRSHRILEHIGWCEGVTGVCSRVS